jgi:uncharacterized protein
MTYLSRLAEDYLSSAIRVQPATIVQGTRQAGKSTLVRAHPGLQQHRYLSLDSSSVREQAIRDPEGLLGSGPRIIIDEVQRVPELLLSIKEVIDSSESREPGRFVLTGSANILSRRIAGESLAGRASHVTVWPFTRREALGRGTGPLWGDLVNEPWTGWEELIRSRGTSNDDWRAEAIRSRYPVPVVNRMSLEEEAVWLDGYIDTFIDRDVRDLAQIARPLDLRRLMRAACASIGQVENQASWVQLTGMKRSTVSRYLDLLEMSFHLIRIPAYSVNRKKRLARSPKIYWGDTAMALRLADTPAPTGFHLENMVVMDLLAWSSSQRQRPGVLHWRTVDGQEGDFVIELPDGRPVAVEVKAERGNGS